MLLLAKLSSLWIFRFFTVLYTKKIDLEWRRTNFLFLFLIASEGRLPAQGEDQNNSFHDSIGPEKKTVYLCLSLFQSCYNFQLGPFWALARKKRSVNCRIYVQKKILWWRRAQKRLKRAHWDSWGSLKTVGLTGLNFFLRAKMNFAKLLEFCG